MQPLAQMPILGIACRAVEEVLAPLLPPERINLVSTDFGMHRDTKKLNEAVQGFIDSTKEPSLVILGYGLCGDGLNGIQAGPHTLLIPRTDDCIPLLLGSYRAFLHEFRTVPGTLYLSKGWLESDDHPLKEYQEYVEKYGPDRAELIMDMQYQHCKRLLFVAHNEADLIKYRPLAHKVARFCERWGMHYEEKLGSDVYLRRFVEVALDLNKADQEFVLVPPKGRIRQADFFR